MSQKLTSQQAGYMELPGATKDAGCKKVEVEGGVSGNLGCCNLFELRPKAEKKFSCGTCEYVTRRGFGAKLAGNLAVVLLAVFIAQAQTYNFPCPGPGWCGWTEKESPVSGQVDTASNTGIVAIQSLAPTFLTGNREWLTWDGVFASSVTVEFSFAGDEGWVGWTEPFSDNQFGLCHPLSHATIAEDAMYCVAIGDQAKCAGIPDTVMGKPPQPKHRHADYTEIDELLNDTLGIRRLLSPPLGMNQHRKLTLTVDTPGQVGIWMAVAPRKSCIPNGVNRRFETYQVQAQ